MNIDERLEKLTERHEALAQSVELLAQAAQSQPGTIDKILEAIRRASENISALARIAEIHDKRIENLGG
jgi:archaellum component FlaC